MYGHSPTEGHLSCFQSCAIMDKVTISLHVRIYVQTEVCISFFLIFFNVYLFLRERVRARVGEGQIERETQNQKQAPGSELSAQSLTRGWNSRTSRS